MYFIKKWFLRKLFRLLRKSPDKMPMVKYWKTKECVAAKVITNKDGALVMQMEGEDEVFPGFPRSHTLFGTLSKLKHEIKDQIFNDSWWALERGEKPEDIIDRIKKLVCGGVKVRDTGSVGFSTFVAGEDCLDRCRYDMVPPEKMVTPVKELWRVFSKLEEKEPRLKWLKEVITYLCQEDDAYRFRVQWIVQIMRPRWYKDPIKWLDLALEELENAEVIGDMKIKIRLLRKIWLLVLQDKRVMELYREFCKEADWDKLKITKADKYFFRGKWFKVDLDKFEY